MTTQLGIPLTSTLIVDEVIGASWAARRPNGRAQLAERVSLTPRPPCLICGHPTGDCTGEVDHG